MKFTPNIFILLIIAIISNSCEEIMNLDTKDIESKMVVYSYLTNEDSVVVVVSPSSSIFGNSPASKYALDAQVMVSVNGTEYQKMTRNDHHNTYKPIDSLANAFVYEYVPQSGDMLSFIVEDLSSGTTLTAETTIPAKPQFEIELVGVDTIKYYNGLIYKDYYQPRFRCTIHDPARDKNYYAIEYINHSGRKSINNVYSEDPIFQNMTEETYFLSNAFFNDMLFDGQSYSFEFSFENSENARKEVGKDIYTIVYGRVRLIQLTEEMYLYFSSSHEALNHRGDLFSQPQQLYTNIQGDGYGFIGGAYHAYSDTLEYYFKCQK